MSPLLCDDTEALLAAAALIGVDEKEKRALDQHLSGCPDCQLTAAQNLTVVAMLPMVVKPVEPSAVLRQRIMATVHIEAVGRQSPQGRKRQARPFDWLTIGRAFTGAGMIAFASVAATVIWTLSTAPDVIRLHGAGTTAQPRAQADLYVDRHDRIATLQVRGLTPPPSPTAIYEVWLIHDGKPQPAAYLQSQPDGIYTTTMSDDMTGYAVLATTLEVQPGNTVPRGTEVFSINLPDSGATAR